MRALIASLRALVLLAHIVEGIAISGVAFPFLRQAARNRIIRVWSHVLLAICGTRLVRTGVALDVRLARHGLLPQGPGRMLLANHISWIDVFAILATMPSRFVAKAEIGRWPLLGWLVTLVGTLYIERGRRHAVAAMNHRVRDHLKIGEAVVVFAEGTTTDGSSLLPFHSNLIAPALEVGCEIWPVALRYTERGAPSAAAGFVGEMGLVTSLWNILIARDFAVEVACLAPLPAAAGRTRHELAALARAAIAGHLGLADPPEATSGSASREAAREVTEAAPPADRAPGRSSAAASASQ